MATSPQAKSRLQIQTIVQSSLTALSLDSSRVKLGIHDLAEDEEFLLALQAAGPYVMVLPSTTARISTTEKILPYHIECQLWLAAADTDFDFISPEDLIFGTNGIVTKLLDYSLYGATAPALHIEVSVPAVRSDLNPIVFMYLIKLEFNGGS